MWGQAAAAGISAGADLIGGALQRSFSKKMQKRKERLAREELEKLRLSPGFFESPNVTASFENLGSRFGGGYTFSPEIQGLYESGLDRANTLGSLFDQYVGPDYFTKGTMFDLFDKTRAGQVAATGRNLSNDVSKLFFEKGIHSGSADEAMRLQEQVNTQNAAADAQRMFSMQKFLGTGLAQNQTAFDYINSMNMMGLDAYGRAQDASTIGTQMDIGKTSAMLGILNSQPTGGGWGQIVSGAGQGISDMINAYQMGKMMEGFGRGGGTTDSPWNFATSGYDPTWSLPQPDYSIPTDVPLEWSSLGPDTQ